MAGMSEITKAIKMQAANMLQKQFLDVAATKLLLIKSALKPVLHESLHLTTGQVSLNGSDEYADVQLTEEAVNQILSVLKLTREEASAARANGGFVYPEEAIQAILDEAVDKLTHVLLGD